MHNPPVITAAATLASGLILAILTGLAACVLKSLDFSGGSNSIRSKRDKAQAYLYRNVLEQHAERRIQHVLPSAQEAIQKIERLEEQMRQEAGCFCALPRFYHKTLCRLTLCKINGKFKEILDLIPDINETITVPNPREMGGDLNHLNTVHIVPHSTDSSTVNPRDEMGGDLNNPNTVQNVSHSGESSSTVNHDNKVGIFNGLAKKILEELKQSSYHKLGVVSIYGMGGIGKSYLAKHVLDKAADFSIKVFITVSQQYNVPDLRKKILQKISKQISDESLGEMTDKQVSDKLCESLNRNRYLIVLDDIWETTSWNDIFFFKSEHHDTNSPKLMFPDKNNGSRIILTTRKLLVAKHPDIKRFEHKVEPLNENEGQKLFKKKAFPPNELVSGPLRTSLERLGSEITKKCRGLPLALVVLGGYLSKHLNYNTWCEVANDNRIWDEIINVNVNQEGQEINISTILDRSYDDLSKELKRVFLYIMAFPEDHVIKSSDLIKLWIAEDFIPSPRDNYKLEATARSYIEKLYERGLVEVERRSRAHGRISKIKIHDVLRHWGIRREDRIFTIISNFDSANHMGNAHVVDRVALHGYWDENLGKKMPQLRTLLGFTLPECAISFLGLKSLQVVSLTSRDAYFQDDITNHMESLRYLCLRNIRGTILPSSIGQLHNLQTLDCRQCNILYLPSWLWEITTLRHVHLRSVECEWLGPKKGLGKNLQSLQFSSLYKDNNSGWNGMVEAVEEMKEIVRLDLDPGYDSLLSDILSKIRSLGSLEVLKLRKILGLTRISGCIFPRSLVKIVLGWLDLEEDPMPLFWELPKLVMLDLFKFSSLKSMHCSAGGFPRLKYLKLDNFPELEEWKVDNGAMPSLYHLRLQSCWKLGSFPVQLMDHNQLQLLELVGMRKLNSADYEKLEMQQKFKVIVAKLGIPDSRFSDL